MAKIIAPAKGYNGTSASVTFKAGVGHTDDPHLIDWFEKKGYTVEPEESAGEKKLTKAEKKAAEEKAAAEEKIKAELAAKAEELKLDLPEGLTVEQVKEAVDAAEREAAEKGEE